MKPSSSSLVIIDSSALIEAHHKPFSLLATHVKSLIESGLAAITPLIRWEMNRGSMTKEEKGQLLEYLDSLEMLDWKMNWKEFERMDHLILRAGFTVPLSDLWIAQTAIEFQTFILHRDKHFDHIASCSPLRIWNPS